MTAYEMVSSNRYAINIAHYDGKLSTRSRRIGRATRRRAKSI